MGASIRRWWSRAVILALGITGFGGCQFSGPAGMPLASQAGRKISDRQTADVQVALGRSYEKRGQTDLAQAAYLEAIKHDPKRTDAYVRLAILHDWQGKFKESAELYGKALQSSPGNPDIFCDMGYSLYLQRRWAEAEMNLQQALALKPEHARAHNNLGLVLAHTDRPDEALAHFRKAGTEADAHLNFAFALTLDQRWEEARTQYELALAANPTLEQAKNGLRELDILLARISRPKPDGNPRAGMPPSTTVAQLLPPSPLPVSTEAPEQITQVAKIQVETILPGTSETTPRVPPPSMAVLPEAPADAATPAAAEPVVMDRAPGISQAWTLFRLPIAEP